MKTRAVNSEITLIPYFPNEEVTFAWYQDRDVCKQVDDLDGTYSMERLKAMYSYLDAHGDCYYISYRGKLVGDVTLRDNYEIAIVICKEYQNRHIGRTVVRDMVALAKEKGYPVVKANIYSFNTQSRAMFRKLGFAQTGEEWFEMKL